MSKYLKKIAAVALAVMAIQFSASAQFVIRVRPAAPVMKVRPACPSPRHVWTNGNWVWRGGQYVWVDGFWAEPQMGRRWVDGHWKSTRRGWVWVPGHWKR